MRPLLATVSLAIAAWSLLLDHAPFSPDSWPCRRGLCRFDQIFPSIDAQGMNLGNIADLLNQDSSNPLVWCTYAGLLSANGQIRAAAAAFERAIALGPGMSP